MMDKVKLLGPVGNKPMWEDRNPPCPTCARYYKELTGVNAENDSLPARIEDVEGVAKVIFQKMYDLKWDKDDTENGDARIYVIGAARALRDHLMGGKG
jgi:hypothetical protein